MVITSFGYSANVARRKKAIERLPRGTRPDTPKFINCFAYEQINIIKIDALL